MIINVAIVAAEQSTRVRVLDVLEVQLMEGSEASGDGILKRIKAARRVSMTQPARTATATASALTTAATTSASKVEAPLSKEGGRERSRRVSRRGRVANRIESPRQDIDDTSGANSEQRWCIHGEHAGLTTAEVRCGSGSMCACVSAQKGTERRTGQ